ncbi:MAG: lipase [Proteobacteria bacterium]|nr:MAG: lipase [Pseudomonadota bacterium]
MIGRSCIMDKQENTDELKNNLTDGNVWKRLLFMILFTMLYSAAEVVLAVVVLYQFLSLLITGNKNEKVLSFGAQISTYAYQVFSYLTFNTEDKPFPMSDWPSDKPLTEKVTPKAAARRAPRKPTAKKTTTRKTPVKKPTPKSEGDKAVDN